MATACSHQVAGNGNTLARRSQVDSAAAGGSAAAA